jgi:hypothetical protein
MMDKEKGKQDSKLFQAAVGLGGEEIPSVPEEFATTKTYDSTVGGQKLKFFPELPKKEWKELLNTVFIVQAIRIVEDWEGMMGTSDFPLIKILCSDGKEYTTLGSGVAILKQCRNLNVKKLLPIRVKLVQLKSTSSGQDYFSFA